jgi:hypothetical protein
LKLQKLGKSTSAIEVSNISIHGIWLYLDGKEYFLPYKHYPWFKEATLAKIQNVQMVRGKYLRWEDLDVDLLVDSLDSPEKYPLVYQIRRKTHGL